MITGLPIVGNDGLFKLYKNAMGVPGFHVAVNVFSPAVHERLFHDPAFLTDFQGNEAKGFVEQDFPILQTIHHPASRRWPKDWHRIINAVRDSGLFPQATIPDNAYGLTYNPKSSFPAHHDGRTKWGEYVVAVNLGGYATITFQHGAPKINPFNPDQPREYVPPNPPVEAYWTKSQTADNVDPYKRRLWQLTMILPPNAMYVISGASRYDWRHGINIDTNHGLFNLEYLLPDWNVKKLRRAVIFRSTK